MPILSQDDYERLAGSNRDTAAIDQKSVGLLADIDMGRIERANEQANREQAEKERKNDYNMERFGWKLVDPRLAVRRQAAIDAAHAITDPNEKLALAKSVANAAQAIQWDKRRRKARKGFVRRFGETLFQIPQALSRGGERMLTEFQDLGRAVVGGDTNKDKLLYRDFLETAYQSGNPGIDPKVNAGWKAILGAAEQAAPIAVGARAFKVFGAKGMATQVGLETFGGIRKGYIKRGATPAAATAIAAPVAGVVGALETYVPVPGKISKGAAGAAKKLAGLIPGGPVAKRIGAGAIGGAAQYAKEVWGEELSQGIAEEAGGQLLEGKFEPKKLMQAGVRGAKEASLPMIPYALFGGGTLGIKGVQDVKTVNKILEYAATDETPSRSVWKKLGLPQEAGESMEDRKTNVKLLAKYVQEQDPKAKYEIADILRDKGLITNLKWQEYQQQAQEQGVIPEGPAATEELALAAPASFVSTETEMPVGKTTQKTVTPEAELSQYDLEIEKRLEAEKFRKSKKSIGLWAPIYTEVEKAASQRILREPLQTKVEETWFPEKLEETRIANELPVSEHRSAVPNAVREFISGQSGQLEIPETIASPIAGSSRKIVKGIAGLLRHRGHAPQVVADLEEQRDSDRLAALREISFAAKKYRKAINKFEKTGDLIDKVNAVSIGEASPLTIPEELREPVTRIRNITDKYSQYLIDLGVTDGDLSAFVEKNKGHYFSRGYLAWIDPTYAENVPEKKRTRFLAYLRQQYPDLTQNELEAKASAMLVAGKAAERELAFIKAGRLGSKDIGVLKQRQNLPEQYREWIGEITDLEAKFVYTATKLASLMANQKFLNDVRDAGKAGGFFSDNPTKNEWGTLDVQIAADASETMSPLNGLWTTKEIKQEFMRADALKSNPWYLQAIITLSSAAKVSATVLSRMATSRNFLGSMGLAAATGHYKLWNVGTPLKDLMQDIIGLSTEEQNDRLRIGTEYGLVGQSTTANELRGYVNDIFKETDPDVESWDEGRRKVAIAKKYARKGLEVPVKIYQAMDDCWKLALWNLEIERYGKAFPDMSHEELLRYTAERVKNTLPTYSRAMRLAEKLRKFPPIAPFVTFFLEVPRCLYNNVKYGLEEIKNPATRSIGASRLVGAMAALSWDEVLSQLSMLLTGVSPDEDKERRKFLPWWQKHNTFLYFGKDGKGGYTYIDLSYMNPFSIIVNPIKTLLRGGDGDAAIEGAIKEFGEPFTGEDLFIGAMTEWWRNKKADGGRVYNPGDTPLKQLEQTLEHFVNTFEPGDIKNARKIKMGLNGEKTRGGKLYNPWQYLLGTLSGVRPESHLAIEQLPWMVKDFNEAIKDNSLIFTGPLYGKGTTNPGDIGSAYVRADSLRRKIYDEYGEKIHAAEKLGIPKDKLVQSLVSGGMTKKNIKALLGGNYIPWSPSNSTIKRIHSANPEEANKRIAELRKAVSIARQQNATGYPRP